jgi:hypothetical protein
MDILNGEVDPDALPPSEMYETNPLPFWFQGAFSWKAAATMWAAAFFFLWQCS